MQRPLKRSLNRPDLVVVEGVPTARAVTVAARSVTIETSGPVSAIRLRRPPVNALDASTLEELGAAADAVSADEECRVVVLASAIDGVFCSGGDLKFWRTFTRERAREVSRAGQEAFARIARLEPGNPGVRTVRQLLDAVERDLRGEGSR